jgi:hypothetical protein
MRVEVMGFFGDEMRFRAMELEIDGKSTEQADSGARAF